MEVNVKVAIQGDGLSEAYERRQIYKTKNCKTLVCGICSKFFFCLLRSNHTMAWYILSPTRFGAITGYRGHLQWNSLRYRNLTSVSRVLSRFLRVRGPVKIHRLYLLSRLNNKKAISLELSSKSLLTSLVTRFDCSTVKR